MSDSMPPATLPAGDEKQLIKAQSLIRGFLSRSSSASAQVRAQKAARSAQRESGAPEPPSPFLPTPHAVVTEMLTLAGVDSTSTVLDIGCGDGRVCLAAAVEKGGRGIGLESLEHVYAKAVELRDAAGMADRVDLFNSDFMAPDNSILQSAMDRANVLFVFLLPSDMQTIVNLTAASIRRKHAQAMIQPAAASAAAAATACVAASSSASSSAALPAASSCPCPVSVRTRIVSWTFSLPSRCPDLALPLEPTHSLPLQSAHTKLHLYDLCYCHLQHHAHASEDGHAYWVAKVFNAPPTDSSAASIAATSPTAPTTASTAPLPTAPADFNVSRVTWGHALNTVPALLARLNEVRPAGLFIECDLRVKPSATGSSSATIEDVILAHDAGADGPSFVEWYETLLAYHAEHPLQPLGLKLDFKQLAAVEPVLKSLQAFAQAGRTLATPATPDASSSPAPPSFPFLWLNADILVGPGAPATAAAVDATGFLALCQRAEFPAGVLSIGWVTGTEGFYTHADVSAMIDLLEAHPSVHQVTFPLRASMVRRSWAAGTIQRLLAQCPNATLTVWTSRVDQAQPHAQEDEEWIKSTLPKHRTFVDLVL